MKRIFIAAYLFVILTVTRSGGQEATRARQAAPPAKAQASPALAGTDAKGQPISNGARDIWVTETALTTALNTGFMSEMLSIFSIIVGVALLLTGIGLVILAFAVFGRAGPATAPTAA